MPLQVTRTSTLLLVASLLIALGVGIFAFSQWDPVLVAISFVPSSAGLALLGLAVQRSDLRLAIWLYIPARVLALVTTALYYGWTGYTKLTCLCMVIADVLVLAATLLAIRLARRCEIASLDFA